MRHLIIKTTVLLSIMSVQSGAHAQIYVCKDSSGRTITSDRYIPECSNKTVRVLDRTGVKRGEIQPPLTAEQKREKELLEEKHKAMLAAAEEQRQSDRALRMRYQNESEIELDRQRTVSAVQDQVKREKAALALVEKRLEEIQTEAAPYKKKGTVPPAALQRRLDEAEQAAKEQAKAVKGREEEAALLNAKYDQTLKRFREISMAAK